MSDNEKIIENFVSCTLTLGNNKYLYIHDKAIGKFPNIIFRFLKTDVYGSGHVEITGR